MTGRKNCHSQFCSHAGTLPLEFSSLLFSVASIVLCWIWPKKTGLPLLDYFITQIFHSIKLRTEVLILRSSTRTAAAAAVQQHSSC